MLVYKSIVWYLTSRNDHCYKLSGLTKIRGKKNNFKDFRAISVQNGSAESIASSYVISHEKSTI